MLPLRTYLVRLSYSLWFTCEFVFGKNQQILKKYLLIFNLALAFLLLEGIPNLSAQSPNDVQFRLIGNFTDEFAYLNAIPTQGLDLDNDGQVDVIANCSCRSDEVIANGTNSDAGLFDDQLVIATGTSGQVWTLSNHQNLLSSIDLLPLMEGDTIPEVGNTGIYVLNFVHSEMIPYIAIVENLDFSPQESFGPIENQCFYPDPEIINLDTFYCDDTENISLLGGTTSPFDNNTEWLSAANELWFITRVEDGEFLFSSVFSPGSLGEGTYDVKLIYDAGSPMEHVNRTGCKRTAEMEVVIQAAYPMVCSNTLSTAIGASSCESVLTPANLLVGTPEFPENFIIDVITNTGVNIGPVLTADYVGQPLTAIITDNCNGAFCTAEIILNDYVPPILILPNDTIISCLSPTAPAQTGFATATDCQSVTVSHQDERINLACTSDSYTTQINRTWSAIDLSGNETTAVQEILLKLGGESDLLFPADVIIPCSDWLQDNSLINGTENGAGTPNLIDDADCRIVATFADDTLPYCGNTDHSFIILRDWTVVNLCTNEILIIDMEGKDNIQFITVLDQTAPEVAAADVVLSANIDQLDSEITGCSTKGFIPAPTFIDDCNDVTVHIYCSIGALDYVNGVDGKDGGFIPSPGLGLGAYSLTYEVTDDCGNSKVIENTLNIIDNTPPDLICNNSLTVILPSNGNGVLFATSVDELSRDNCCVESTLIKVIDEPTSAYRPFIEFYCTNDTLEVVLRVTDCFGNFNECSSQVIVLDNQAPYVVDAVADEFFYCEDDISAYENGGFQASTFGDNCNFELSFSTYLDVNSCGIGQLIRRWEAKDNDRNDVAVDTQLIWLQARHDYEITLPGDEVDSCPFISANEVEVKNFECDMLTANVYFDTLITNNNGICMTIFRNYTVVNWCEYDGVSEVTILPRLVDNDTGLAESYVVHSDGEVLWRSVPGTELPIGVSTGFYAYQQQVHIVDSHPPLMEIQSLTDFCLGSECLGQVNFDFLVTDDCTALPFVAYDIRNAMGIFVPDTIGQLVHLSENSYRIAGQYPVGSYEFEVELRDNCGAIGRVAIIINVNDCTAPELLCVEEIFIDLNEDEQFILFVNDILLDATDDCGQTNVFFEGEGGPEQLVFDCSDIGVDTIQVGIMDEAGNSSYCEVVVHLNDTNINCTAFYDISGIVVLAEGDGVGDVFIQLTGGMQSSTSSETSGDFLFEEIEEGNAYQLIAQREDTYINGVSTFDIIQIQRHLLGTSPFTSPYKILAADVNDSGLVSTLDIIFMRKLILGLNTSFPNRTSPWFFVPKDYEFTDPTLPFQDDFPKKITIESLGGNRIDDFIGIKIGDVNNSVSL